MFFALVFATVASSTADVYLDQAKVLYQNLDYEKCLKRLEKARTSATASDDSASIALYIGLCSAGLSRSSEARAAFVLAGKLNPALRLPAGASPKVRELFESAVSRADPQGKVTTPPAVPTPASVPVEASPDAVLVPAVRPALPAAAVTLTSSSPRKLPVLGIVAAGLSVLALGGGIAFGISAQNNVGLAKMAMFDSEMRAFSDRALGYALAANVMYVGAGIAAVLALLGFVVN